MCKDLNNKVVYHRNTKKTTCEGTEFKKELTHWFYTGREEEFGKRLPPKHIQVLAKWIKIAHCGAGLDMFEENDWTGSNDKDVWYDIAYRELNIPAKNPRQYREEEIEEKPLHRTGSILRKVETVDEYSNLSYSDLLLQMAGKIVCQPIPANQPLPEGFSEDDFDNKPLEERCAETNKRLVETNLNIPDITDEYTIKAMLAEVTDD